MSSERMQILKMLEQGQVSAQEAGELLAALEKPGAKPRPEAMRGRRLRVQVIELSSGKSRVNVTVPLSMVDVALRMGARFVPKTSELDPQRILQAIHSGDKGLIIEYEDRESDERVEVYID